MDTKNNSKIIAIQNVAMRLCMLAILVICGIALRPTVHSKCAVSSDFVVPYGLSDDEDVYVGDFLQICLSYGSEEIYFTLPDMLLMTDYNYIDGYMSDYFLSTDPDYWCYESPILYSPIAGALSMPLCLHGLSTDMLVVEPEVLVPDYEYTSACIVYPNPILSDFVFYIYSSFPFQRGIRGVIPLEYSGDTPNNTAFFAFDLAYYSEDSELLEPLSFLGYRSNNLNEHSVCLNPSLYTSSVSDSGRDNSESCCYHAYSKARNPLHTDEFADISNLYTGIVERSDLYVYRVTMDSDNNIKDFAHIYSPLVEPTPTVSPEPTPTVSPEPTPTPPVSPSPHVYNFEVHSLTASLNLDGRDQTFVSSVVSTDLVTVLPRDFYGISVYDFYDFVLANYIPLNVTFNDSDGYYYLTFPSSVFGDALEGIPLGLFRTYETSMQNIFSEGYIPVQLLNEGTIVGYYTYEFLSDFVYFHVKPDTPTPSPVPTGCACDIPQPPYDVNVINFPDAWHVIIDNLPDGEQPIDLPIPTAKPSAPPIDQQAWGTGIQSSEELQEFISDFSTGSFIKDTINSLPREIKTLVESVIILSVLVGTVLILSKG